MNYIPRGVPERGALPAAAAYIDELDKLGDAHKQFFLRRSNAHFRASEFSTILRGAGIGILGKEGF